jgi:DNA-directed RNA polymerase sigma subunit (sigma70/sigma32)
MKTLNSIYTYYSDYQSDQQDLMVYELSESQYLLVSGSLRSQVLIGEVLEIIKHSSLVETMIKTLDKVNTSTYPNPFKSNFKDHSQVLFFEKVLDCLTEHNFKYVLNDLETRSLRILRDRIKTLLPVNRSSSSLDTPVDEDMTQRIQNLLK